MKKAQTWSLDAIVAIGIFIVVIIGFFYIIDMSSKPNNAEKLKDEGETIPDILISSETGENQSAIVEKKVDEEKREQSDLGGFGDNLSARDKALAIKILNKQKRFDGGAVITVKEKIKELIKNGELELKVREENKIKDMPRRSYNRATNEEQARHALKQKEAGKVKVYMVSGYDLGKTAYDYAEYILSKKG